MCRPRAAAAGLPGFAAGFGRFCMEASDSAAASSAPLSDPARAALTISEALLDQRALAGIGNIWRNETLFHERVDPWASVADLDEATIDRLIATARDLLRRSAGMTPGRAAMWVYRRAGRPCRRCGTLVRSAAQDTRIQRTTYWCPTCQPAGAR